MQKYYYKTISQHTRHEIPKIKGSRFIGNIFPISNKEQAEEYIAQVKKQHHGANHNCFAYTYGTNINFDLFGNIEITATSWKQSDDGEPANTAGKPILAQIQGHNLHNILIVVTRYFGGTLLGIGGLIQAYSTCAKETILLAQKENKIIDVELTKNISINTNYSHIHKIMQLINKYEAKITKQTDGDTAQIDIQINEGYISNFKKEISNHTKGDIQL